MVNEMDKNQDYRAIACLQILVLPHTSCVTLMKLLHFFLPLFLHL